MVVDVVAHVYRLIKVFAFIFKILFLHMCLLFKTKQHKQHNSYICEGEERSGYF
jgi:hypothetical protein